MSDIEDELDSAQKKQHNVEEAALNPETSGPAENLREKPARMTDKSQDLKNLPNEITSGYPHPLFL
jgi:hypothetical protein